MDANDPEQLNDLSTSWTLLQAAHDPAAATGPRDKARRELVERYLAVVRRYLGGALRLEKCRDEAVEELVQEFGLRVMAGSLHNVTPDRGRFRYYLRTVLSNLVREYQRKKNRQPAPLGDEDVVEEEQRISEDEFTEMWREELVRRSLGALAAYEQETGQILYTALKLAMDEPGLQAVDLAVRLSGRLGRNVDAAWARKRIFLAREKLRELLRREVKQSLQEPSAEAIDQELADVGLLAYCR